MPPTQSASVALQPLGQQPSPEVHAVMAVLLQATLQFSALPVSRSSVHAMRSSQLAGHEAGGSQVSPLSSEPLPQLAEQSTSVVWLQPAGQQPSPELQMTMVLNVHATLQVAVFPVCWFVVQALPSSHAVGHVLGGSQVSPELTTPLPQVAPVSPDPPAPLEDPPVPGWLGEDGVFEHAVTSTVKQNISAASEFLMCGVPRGGSWRRSIPSACGAVAARGHFRSKWRARRCATREEGATGGAPQPLETQDC
jgi:hypothetical protein